MLRSTILVSIYLLGFAGSGFAGGSQAPFQPVDGFAPPSIGFDDRLGKGFTWNKQLPCGADRATVTVKFDKAYPSANGLHVPVAKVWLHSGHAGEASEQWIAAVIKAPTDAQQLNAQTWLEKLTGRQSEGPGFAPADLSKPMQIDIAWTPDGVVSVDFGGEIVKHVTADEPITDIGLAGSWSKFDFIDFKVGHSAAADIACKDAASTARP